MVVEQFRRVMLSTQGLISSNKAGVVDDISDGGVPASKPVNTDGGGVELDLDTVTISGVELPDFITISGGVDVCKDSTEGLDEGGNNLSFSSSVHDRNMW